MPFPHCPTRNVSISVPQSKKTGFRYTVPTTQKKRVMTSSRSARTMDNPMLPINYIDRQIRKIFQIMSGRRSSLPNLPLQ